MIDDDDIDDDDDDDDSDDGDDGDDDDETCCISAAVCYVLPSIIYIIYYLFIYLSIYHLSIYLSMWDFLRMHHPQQYLHCQEVDLDPHSQQPHCEGEVLQSDWQPMSVRRLD